MSGRAAVPRAVIHYDVAEISAERVRAVRARTSGPVVETARADLEWPNGLEGAEPRRVGSYRSANFVNRVWEWTDGLIRELDGAGPIYQGVSLAGVARYAFLFEVAPWLHRLDAANILTKAWESEEMVWVHSLDRRDAAQLRGLLHAQADNAGKWVMVASGSGRPWYRRARTSCGRALAVVTSFVRFLRSVARRGADLEASVVFTEYFPNSVHASLPVARALAKDHLIHPTWIAARREVADALTGAGMSSVDLDETIVRPFRIRSSVRRNVREVVRRFVGQDVSLFDEQPANSDALVELLSAALLETMASAARWVDRYSVALERLRPRMLVSTTFSSIPGRAAAGVARGIGAVTVYLQHGLLPAEPYVTSHCHDYKLVWGDQDRRLLLHHGHSPESVAVVGSTLYDDLVQRTTAASRPFPMQDEPLDVLFFASRTGGAVVSQATAERTLRTAALVVQGMDNIRLTVKVHPADGTDLPESVLGDEPNVRVVRAGRSADLVQKTDLVLITSSTTGFEACIADRPLIILNLTGSTEVTQLVDAGAALEAHSATELKACIEELRANPAARDKLARGRVRVRADRLGGAHGDAARRAADFLARLDRAPAA